MCDDEEDKTEEAQVEKNTSMRDETGENDDEEDGCEWDEWDEEEEVDPVVAEALASSAKKREL